MTLEDIIRMARESGLVRTGDGWTEPHRWGMTEIERFAALVAAAEREAAEERVTTLFEQLETPYLPDIVRAIRARGQP